MSELELMSKACTKCGETKALTEFYKHKGKPGGRASQCKSCLRESVDAWQERKRDEMGDEAWRKYRREATTKSRRKESVRERVRASNRARGRAAERLIDAYRDVFDRLLQEERYKEGLL